MINWFYLSLNDSYLFNFKVNYYVKTIRLDISLYITDVLLAVGIEMLERLIYLNRMKKM